MGFFSWNCKGCGHSIRSIFSTVNHSKWMIETVVLFKDPHKHTESGRYDGYGRFEHFDVADAGDEDRNLADEEPFEMYHKACHEILGSPKKFNTASESARDQGYFNTANLEEPKSLEDIENLKNFIRTEEILEA